MIVSHLSARIIRSDDLSTPSEGSTLSSRGQRHGSNRSDDIPEWPLELAPRRENAMTSKVRISMFPCDNKTTISVETTEDGDFTIKATSSCSKAERFVNGLGPLTMEDLTNKREGRIFKEFLASDMSCNCLVVSGAITAAWVEAGLIAGSNARKGVPLTIEFIND